MPIEIEKCPLGLSPSCVDSLTTLWMFFGHISGLVDSDPRKSKNQVENDLRNMMVFGTPMAECAVPDSYFQYLSVVNALVNKAVEGKVSFSSDDTDLLREAMVSLEDTMLERTLTQMEECLRA